MRHLLVRPRGACGLDRGGILSSERWRSDVGALT